jgi:hypothetical protein
MGMSCVALLNNDLGQPGQRPIRQRQLNIAGFEMSAKKRGERVFPKGQAKSKVIAAEKDRSGRLG